ncbi:hypothetical protein A8144_00555 [Mycobacterium leprae 3125609]|nr:hypothetical protein A8144_00555 [Mycobacterium leprae 3125609]OAX72271.1 hypothetical protein A3216_00615 [Mycobacterium leprae 7935681]
MIAASVLGTAIALVKLVKVAGGLGLTVALKWGLPPRKLAVVKVLMLQARRCDDVAVAVMVHPGPTDRHRHGPFLELSELTIEYLGKESHAVVAPPLAGYHS